LKLNIREASRDDLPHLLELEQRVVEAERAFSPDIKAPEAYYYDIEQLIADDACLLLVAEDAGAIVATGYAQIKKSKASLAHNIHAYLGFMYVSPSFRGQGLNQEITGKLVTWSQQQGVSTLYLDVYAENAPAIRAYEKIGFQPCLLEMKLSL